MGSKRSAKRAAAVEAEQPTDFLDSGKPDEAVEAEVSPLRVKRGLKVNKSGLAEVLGCTMTTVGKHVQNGCPVEKEGSNTIEWVFDTAQVIAWLRARDIADARGANSGSSSEGLRRRERAANAGLRELELRRKLGEVVPIEDVRATVSEQFSFVRSRLTSIPGRLAQELAAESDPDKIEKAIKAEVVEALTDLTADRDDK